MKFLHLGSVVALLLSRLSPQHTAKALDVPGGRFRQGAARPENAIPKAPAGFKVDIHVGAA
jgi:hypothetical protein